MSSQNEAAQREFIIRRFAGDKAAAHRHLFAHRHKNATPEFHQEILKIFHAEHPLVALQAFRGAAKSTLIEEYIILEVLFRTSRYAIIVGNTWSMAVQRLFAIKNEFTTNEALIELFGDQQGQKWTDDEIILSNGAKVQALGARQSLRGAKNLDARPDLAVIDDFEDEEGVATDEAIFKNNQWLYKVLLPALDISSRRVRMLGTPLSPKAMMETHMNNPLWLSKRFPICHYATDGEVKLPDPITAKQNPLTGHPDLNGFNRPDQPVDPNDYGDEVSAWPDRFPMKVIRDIRKSYEAEGNMTAFMQEYMCRAEDSKSKPFQQSMIRTEPAPKVWLPTEIMVDPARTTGTKSARTGYAVWSWNGPQLIVREAFGRFHKPDEVIKTIMELDEKFEPCAIGVEVDGLEEFLMQPLRTAMTTYGRALPLEPQRAPRDKDAFITSLQPFYFAKEVIHVKDLPDLNSELLQFPIGRKDVPNALAYALRMRPGRPVYGDFSAQHITTELDPYPRAPLWLALSSRPSLTAAVLAQYHDGIIYIYRDWVNYGAPQEQLVEIIREAAQVAPDFKMIAPMEQFDKFNNHGLPAAAMRLKLNIQQGGSSKKGEGGLTPWLKKSTRGVLAFQVDDRCRWLVNGLSRGYARKLGKDGRLVDQPYDNQYKVLVEALEAYISVFDVVQENSDVHSDRRYATAPNGRRYLSSLPTRG